MRRITIALLGLAVALGALLWLVHGSPAPRGSTGTEKSIALSEEAALPAPSATPLAVASAASSTEARLDSAREAVEVKEEEPAPSAPASAVTASGVELDGQVLDDSGAAVRRFYLSYIPGADLEEMEHPLAYALQRSAEPERPRRSALTNLVTDDKGRFRIAGLQPGNWAVKPFAQGYVDLDWTLAAAPGPRLKIVLARAGRVSGVVLDSRGAPVADAHVRTVLDSRLSATTDAQGAFALAGFGGSATLFAEHPGDAPSRPLALDVAPGETLEGVELRLRAPATIEGEVLDSAGKPCAQVKLLANCEHELFRTQATTDPAGHFRFADLPPGDYVIQSFPSDVFGDPQKTTVRERLREDVVLHEGETARIRIVLGLVGALRLHGRVLLGAAPMTAGSVSASRANEPEGGSADRWDVKEGAYEIELPGPGAYRLAVQDGSLSWRTSIDVPDVPEYAHDIVLPIGHIAGRVLSFDGKPLADYEVASEPERHGDDGHGSARTRTDDEGRYELALPAGLHAVRAGGRDLQHGSLYAEARVGDLEVKSGATLSGVDLVLNEGGKLEGRVRFADGSPAGEAELWSFAAPRPRALGRSARDGSFHLGGLASGSIWLGATRDDAATRERVLVEIAPGSTPHVELVLEPAVRIHVLARAAGVLVGCELALVDANGISYPVRSDRPGEAWFGPLAAGSYVVSARRETQHAERVLALDGAEKKLDVELALE